MFTLLSKYFGTKLHAPSGIFHNVKPNGMFGMEEATAYRDGVFGHGYTVSPSVSKQEGRFERYLKKTVTKNASNKGTENGNCSSSYSASGKVADSDRV